MDFDNINASIRNNGFSRHSLQLMDDYTNDIINGKTNITRFNQAEHAGLCRAGEMLIGAYIVCNYAQASLAAGADAGASQAGPANWEIDEDRKIWYSNEPKLSKYGIPMPRLISNLNMVR